MRYLEMFKPAVLSLPVFLSACLSCGPIEDLRDFADADLFPPVIERVLPVSGNVIRLDFNEAVDIESVPVLVPPLGTPAVRSDGNSVFIEFPEAQQSGTRYTIDAAAVDKTGNSMSFLIPFYGFNPDLPGILINEFTTQGSSNHPDVVELYVTESGNTAGLWIVEGTTDFPEDSICLPACTVETGDFLLIHFKPQGISEEIDEDGSDVTLSGGHDATDTARDFWVQGGNGLSGNNGVIAVYAAPGGRVVDAVLYSNRTSASDEKYGGFGSRRMLDKALQITEEEGWTTAEAAPRPEDAVDPEDSTATRSICRGSVPGDTDSRTDWHIVPTSGYSFGEVNIDDVYIKP